MDFRRLPVLAGSALAGLLVLGGCAGAPETPTASPAPAAVSAPTGVDGQAPCTARLRPGGGGGGGLTLTPEVQAQIERLRQTPGPDARATPPDPALASRLADVSARVERAAQPCTDR
ncbi:hypothetical protein EV188_102926 [Actinomycetospora succinea]|uniref:Uncharacterized protein n=1 Tax=Actinomycetospora succinea TaxID=663603 RepID=A0A4R6VMT4_9PSEU|nr:hypothetical protein [Actinomycetospora succinea]TDQ63269.1 hypothetical protein EV188_102926 [Actinomycetospora succinea]